MSRLVLAWLLLLTLLVGCSARESSGPSESASSPPDGAAVRDAVVEPSVAAERIAAGAELLDVRTPEEFADGHLDGAVNLDAQATDFTDRAADLHTGASYVVYCATGRRAAAAIDQLSEVGIDRVVNAGGYEALAQSPDVVAAVERRASE